MELLLAGLVGLLSAGSLRLVDSLLARRKDSAVVEHTQADTDRIRVEALQQIIDSLTARVAALDTEVGALNDKIKRHLPWDEDMANRLSALGQPVPPRPPL